MTVIKPDVFLRQLQADPQQSVSVIIRTSADPKARAPQIERLGLTVTRTITLVPSIAATGPAKAVLTLASESWVVSIEPDQPVHTMV